jgi:hypothetical protein
MCGQYSLLLWIDWKMTAIRLVAVSKVSCQFNSHLRTLLHELWVSNTMNSLQLKVFNKFKDLYNFCLKQSYVVELNMVLLELSESSCTIWTRIRMRNVLRPLDWIWHFMIECCKCSCGALCQYSVLLLALHNAEHYYMKKPFFYNMNFKWNLKLPLKS